MAKQQYRLEAYVAQAIGSRLRQEDAMMFSSEEASIDKGVLAVLADGMGGMADGDKFSGIATQEMIAHFENEPLEPDMCQCLLNCYAAAQKRAIAEQEPDDDEGGSTVTALLIRQDESKCECAFLSVGDSRIYLLRGEGLIQLNREQVLGPLLDERAALGVISREEAEMNIRRNALINHLGREGMVECDVCAHPFKLVQGDRLVLMSDGVFGTLNDDELLELLQRPLEETAEAVIDAVVAKDKPRQDNCSILLIGIEPLENDGEQGD